jgi:hypothetical protein
MWQLFLVATHGMRWVEFMLERLQWLFVPAPVAWQSPIFSHQAGSLRLTRLNFCMNLSVVIDVLLHKNA